MFRFLNDVSYSYLIFIAVIMALAPFTQQPHLMEKFQMLKKGTLRKPIDIFDVFFHLIPTILHIIKFVQDKLFISN